MAKSKNHTGFRNGSLFCFNCGASYDMRLPQLVSMAGAMMKQFDKDHKSCKKTWSEPVPHPEGKSEQENAEWWLENGEHGISSKTMFYYMNKNWHYYMSRLQLKEKGHPSDPDDFRRCYLLLKAVPQFKDKLFKMKDVSPVWSSLVDNWDMLTDLLEEQMKTNKDTGMYDLMKKIGC